MPLHQQQLRVRAITPPFLPRPISPPSRPPWRTITSRSGRLASPRRRGRSAPAPLSSPDHLPFHKRGDVRAQTSDSYKVHIPSEEVFEEEGEVHEVVEGGNLELHEDVDVARRLLLAPSMRAEDSDPFYAEPPLNLILVLYQELQRLHPTVASKKLFSAYFLGFGVI